MATSHENPFPHEGEAAARETAKRNLNRAQQAYPRALDRKEDKIAKNLSKLSNPQEKLQVLLKLADELYKPLAIYIACQKNCSSCCQMPIIDISQLEAAEISEKSGTPISPSPPRNHTWEACPFLKDDACSIYEHRPFFCRTHVVFTQTATWCAPDKCNEMEMPKIAFPNLLKAYVDLPKGEVRDIREVFAKSEP